MELFLAAFITVFVIADPVGTAAVFATLTQGMPAKETRSIAVKTIIVALSLYAFFGLFGLPLLNEMNVSLAAFRIAGGLLLFVTGFRMIMGRHDQGALQRESDNPYPDRSHIAIFPLAFPLLSGPGCLTALLLMLERANHNTMDIAQVVIAVILVQLIALICFLAASKLMKRLGPGVMSIIARVMGILLASMAVQFVVDGMKALWL